MLNCCAKKSVTLLTMNILDNQLAYDKTNQLNDDDDDDNLKEKVNPNNNNNNN